MKKFNSVVREFLVCAVLTLVCTGFVFAQEQTDDTKPVTRKNAITLDALTLFKGFIASDGNSDSIFGCISLGYEGLILPHFSIGAEIDVYPGKLYDKDYMFWGLAAAARYYPMSEYMEKFFIGALIGFNMQLIDWQIDADSEGFYGMFAGLRAGYKLQITDIFFIEPSMSYIYSKTNFELMGLIPHNYGWQASLRFGLSL
jgi:opacity protein-like surface antigen